MVAELVSASYLIDTLSMLKVEGSKHGRSETSFRFVKLCLEHFMRCSYFRDAQTPFLDGKRHAVDA